MASGNSLVSFVPADNEPPTANYATLDVRNGHPVLDFDAATEEAAIFTAVLPRHYAGGGLTIYLHWLATSAVAGDSKWGGSIERATAGGDDLDADSFDAEQTATGTANAVSGVVTTTQIAFTNAQIDGLLVGEAFRLKLARKAADAADTMAGDAELLAVEIKET